MSNMDKKPKLCRAVAIIIAICCFAGCRSRSADESQPAEARKLDGRIEKFLGGKSTLTFMTEADRAIAFRMDRRGKAIDGELREFHGYPVTSEAVAVPRTAVGRLVTVLGNPEHYLWDAGKACKFDPGVGMRFSKNGTHVDLVFCFTCDQLLLVAGEHKRLEDTDPARGELLRIMKEVFPEDRLIQGFQ
jgi:hypothetical protein